MGISKPSLAAFGKLGDKIVKVGGPRLAKAGFAVKKNAPVILLAAGGTLIVGGAVYACKRTLGTSKQGPLDREIGWRMDNINMNKEAIADPGNEDDIPEIKKEIRSEWIHTGIDLGKRYAVPVLMISGGLTCVIAARNIEHSRFLVAMASVESLNAAFTAYRARVVEEQGPAADKRYMEGTYDAEADFFTEQEDKRKKPKKETKAVTGGKIPGSPYAVIFSEETSTAWSDDRADNKYFLDTTCVYLNQRLHERGYLFLSEVYEALGIDYEPIAQISGWIIPVESDEEPRDGEVHIFMTEMYLEEEIERSRLEHTNPCPQLRLDFNVDGIIWDKINAHK